MLVSLYVVFMQLVPATKQKKINQSKTIMDCPSDQSLCVNSTGPGAGVGGGGSTQQSFIRRGSALRSKPLPFYILFLIYKVPFSYTFHRKFYPFSLEKPLNCTWMNQLLSASVGDILKGPINTKITVFPALFYTSTHEIPTLLYTSSLKKVPLSGGASPYSPL